MSYSHFDGEVFFVECNTCSNETGDMGPNMPCDACGEGGLDYVTTEDVQALLVADPHNEALLQKLKEVDGV